MKGIRTFHIQIHIHHMPRGKPVFMTYMRTKERGNKSSQRADPPLLDAKEKKRKIMTLTLKPKQNFKNERVKHYSGYHAGKQGVSQCTVEWKRTPSGMRVVVWVPGKGEKRRRTKIGARVLALETIHASWSQVAKVGGTRQVMVNITVWELSDGAVR